VKKTSDQGLGPVPEENPTKIPDLKRKSLLRALGVSGTDEKEREGKTSRPAKR